MVAATMIMLPSIGSMPNIWLKVEPAPANMTTATPNRKNVIRKSRMKPI